MSETGVAMLHRNNPLLTLSGILFSLFGLALCALIVFRDPTFSILPKNAIFLGVAFAAIGASLFLDRCHVPGRS
jgi:hypothetical protein